MPLNLGIPRSYGLRVYRSTSQAPLCKDSPHGPLGLVELEPELAHDHNGWHETTLRQPGWSEQLLATQSYPQRYAAPQRNECVKNSITPAPVSPGLAESPLPPSQHIQCQERHKDQRQLSPNTELQSTPLPQDPASRSQQQQQHILSNSQMTPKRKSKGLMPLLRRQMHDTDSPTSSPASPATPTTPRSNASDASEALANMLANIGIQQWPSQPLSDFYLPVESNREGRFTGSSRSELKLKTMTRTTAPVKRLNSDQSPSLLPSAVERGSGSIPVLQPTPASAPAGITTHATSASMGSASSTNTFGTGAALAVACSTNSPGVTVARAMTLSRPAQQHRQFSCTGEKVKPVSPRSSQSSLCGEFEHLSTQYTCPSPTRSQTQTPVTNPGLSPTSSRGSSSASTSSSWNAHHAINDCSFDFSSGPADEATVEDVCLDWLDYGNGDVALLRDVHIQKLYPAKGRAQLVLYVAGREVHV